MVLLVNALSCMGFVKISSQTGADNSESLLAGLDAKSMLSNFFDKNSSIEELLKQTFNSLTSELDNDSLKSNNDGDHSKPDKKVRRVILANSLRNTQRRLWNAFDIRKYLNKGDQTFTANLGKFCEDGKTCPYLDLLKKQYGRLVENINDEIAFIDNVNKDKKCEYLELKKTLLGRIAENLNLVIKWIDDNNKPDSLQGCPVELAKQIVENAIKNLQDTKNYIERQLAKEEFEGELERKGDCPYIDLKVRLVSRKTANDVDTLMTLKWIQNRKRTDGSEEFLEEIRSIVREVKEDFRKEGLAFTSKPKRRSFSKLNIIPLDMQLPHFDQLEQIA